MRNKKMFLSGVFITTAMLLGGGCGKQPEPVNAEATVTVKEADTEESMESSEGENNSSSAGPVEPARTSEPAESVEPTQTPEPAEPAEPIETAEPIQTQKPIETVKPAQTEKPAETPKATEIPAQPEAPVQPSRPEVPAQPETPAQPSQPEAPIQPEAPSQPAHQHTWRDHVVTTQIWISNIVVVEDYGTIPGESYGYFVCDCGYGTEDASAIESHVVAHVESGDAKGFTIQTLYRESTTGVIGTHEEDQGHYETSSYVDYQYCDCGATK